MIRTNCTLVISKKDNHVVEIISDFSLYKEFHTDCSNSEIYYTVRARFASKGTVKTPDYRMSRRQDGTYLVHPLHK